MKYIIIKKKHEFIMFFLIQIIIMLFIFSLYSCDNNTKKRLSGDGKKVKLEEMLNNGYRVIFKYYTNKMIKSKEYYRNCKLNGTIFYYGVEGYVLNKINYSNGVKHGVYYKFNSKGDTTIHAEFNNGIPMFCTIIRINERNNKNRLINKEFYNEKGQCIRDVLIIRKSGVNDTIDDSIYLIPKEACVVKGILKNRFSLD